MSSEGYEYGIKACAPDRDMWEQQPGESDDFFAKFSYYLRLGTSRSLPLVADAYGLSIRTIRNSARDYLWKPRANAYDNHEGEQHGRNILREATESNLRSIQSLGRLREFLVGEILSRPPSEFTISQLTKLADVVFTNQVRYIGMPTYRPDAAAGLGVELPGIDPDGERRQAELNAMLSEYARRTAVPAEPDEQPGPMGGPDAAPPAG